MRRLIVLGGIAGPLLLTLMVIAVAALRLGYSHYTQFISELGETGADLAWLVNYFGFMIPALLILVFSYALLIHFPRSPLSIAGSILVMLYAVSVFMASIFSCDVGCTPATPTLAQNLHNAAAIFAFPSLILAPFIWGVYFIRVDKWRRFAYYSMATAAVSLLSLIAMVVSIDTRTGTGLTQRILLGSFFLWLALLATRLWRETADIE